MIHGALLSVIVDLCFVLLWTHLELYLYSSTLMKALLKCLFFETAKCASMCCYPWCLLTLVYLYTTCACLPLLMVGNNKCVQSYTALVVSDAWFDLSINVAGRVAGYN